ncbi:hypothetical protein [Phocaeicola sp.]
MNKPTFRIIKSSFYSNGEKDWEDFSILMYNHQICSADRKEIEELYQQLTLALNDKKEDTK